MLLQIVNPPRLIQNHEIPEPVCYPLRSWRCMLFAAVCESGQGERDIAGDGDSATEAKSTRPTDRRHRCGPHSKTKPAMPQPFLLTFLFLAAGWLGKHNIFTGEHCIQTVNDTRNLLVPVPFWRLILQFCSKSRLYGC